MLAFAKLKVDHSINTKLFNFIKFFSTHMFSQLHSET
jgi:hypothetical protein